MWVPAAGMLVEIKNVGRGKILKTNGKKILVSINALGGREVELDIDLVSPVDTEFTDTKETTLINNRNNINQAYDKQDHIALKRRAIESLRFGLVPEQYIEELTLGFDKLSEWTERCLKKCVSFNPSGFEISGPYGTGKSHILAVVRYLARKQGFLTVRAEVDGQNVSFANPSLLLYTLWSSLAENDIDSDYLLLSLYIDAIMKGNIPTTIISKGNDKIRNNMETIYTLMRTGNLDKYANIIEAIISSSDEITKTQAINAIRSEYNIDHTKIRLENMMSRKLSERAFDFVESLAGHAILSSLCGYKGLIVTIDEFETEYMCHQNIPKIIDIFSALNQYFNKTTHYNMAPLGIFIASVDQEGYHGDRLIESYLALEPQSRYRLTYWNGEQRVILAEKIYKIYTEAYMINQSFQKGFATAVDNILAQKIENNNDLIRAFIKWYVGLLDIKYGPPGEQ